MRLGDEKGTTLVELMVGLAAGMVVLAALSMVLITTVRTTARVSARVDATQRARIVLTKVTEELHSGCLLPQIAPILPDSNATSLSFVRPTSATVSSVAPTPRKTVVRYSGGSLEQSDYAWLKGSSPGWEFATSAEGGQTLLTKVAPLGGVPIFKYWKFSEGALKEVEPKLVEGKLQIGAEASAVVEVQLALNAAPLSTPVADPGADSSVQDSAVFRLTPPTFPQAATALPCT